MKKLFAARLLMELGVPTRGDCVISETIADIQHDTISNIEYRVVFRFPNQTDGTAWECTYVSPATDEIPKDPWDILDRPGVEVPVECALVRPRQVLQTVWLEVDE